jgi:hypothetical protein
LVAVLARLLAGLAAAATVVWVKEGVLQGQQMEESVSNTCWALLKRLEN